MVDEEGGSTPSGAPVEGGSPVSTEVMAAESAVAAGWYPDPNSPGTDRYWNGSEWTDQTQAGSVSTTKKSADERKATLAQQIQMSVAQGARVESQSEFQAVLIKGKPVNHTLHAILSFFTVCLWAPVWAIIALTGGEKGQMIMVDEFGNATVQNTGKR